MDNVLINGQPGALLPVSDRAFQYGDGLFETIAVTDGVPRLWRYHYNRLKAGCERLALPLPDETLLREELALLAGGVSKCVVKIILSRGSGGRGYRSPKIVAPTRVVMRYPFPDYPEHYATHGIAVRLCDMRLGCNPKLAGIKHLNRLEQILARNEWDDETITEGVMLDSNGHLVDGIMSNLFLVSGGELYTPDLSRCGVAGVMREAVIAIAGKQGIALHIAPLLPEQLRTADELFVTNALIGIWPVRCCGESTFAPGPVTRHLQSMLATTLELSDA